jgi:hypothetical protein
MSRIQKILKSLLPAAFFAEIEEESRKWFMECDTCGYAISYRVAGEMRAYAAGKKRIFGGYKKKYPRKRSRGNEMRQDYQ